MYPLYCLLRSEAAIGRTLTLSGAKAWTTQEVIALCEKLSSSNAKVGEQGVQCIFYSILVASKSGSGQLKQLH